MTVHFSTFGPSNLDFTRTVYRPYSAILTLERQKEIPIKAGEMFLLPGRVPHSPRRYPGSMGLVIERERESDERDALRYYCKDKETILHQRVFYCQDLGKELGPIIKERINWQLNG